jgi:conjugative transfer pilus assembly protein TraH
MKMINIAFTVALLLFSVTSSAAIQDEIEDLFDGLMTSTAPQEMNDQRRGVYSGGSFTARNKVVSLNVINFKPPRVMSKGSCNSINLYGGSISFVKADQVVEFLRAVGANIVMYTFNIALSSVCERCAQWMNKIQEIVNWMNDGFKDSCKFAKTLVDNTYGKPLQSSVKEATQMSWLPDASTAGDFDDTGQGISGWMAGLWNPETQSASSQFNNTLKGEMIKDYTWEALREANAGNWFLADTVDMPQIVHAMVGPVRVQFSPCSPPAGNPSALGAELTPCNQGSRIKFSDIFRADKGPDLPVWDCDISNTADLCMNTNGPNATVTYDGVVDYIRGVLESLYPKFRTPSALDSLSIAERSLLTNTPYPLAALFRTAAIKQISMDDKFDSLAKQIAFDTFSVYIDSIWKAVEEAARSSTSDSQKDLIETILTSKAQYQKDKSLFLQKFKAFNQPFSEAAKEIEERRFPTNEVIEDLLKTSGD